MLDFYRNRIYEEHVEQILTEHKHPCFQQGHIQRCLKCSGVLVHLKVSTFYFNLSKDFKVVLVLGVEYFLENYLHFFMSISSLCSAASDEVSLFRHNEGQVRFLGRGGGKIKLE